VSNGDNSNILAARVARESYGVTNVVARIYDPGRAEIYQRLGIPTVATVIWATDQILRRIAPGGARSEWRDATGTVQLLEVHPHLDWYGRPISELEAATHARVAFLTRLGEGLIPEPHTVLQDGDLIHMTIRDDAMAAAEATLTQGPGA
jgi:trk system potassium uptake protein TrkA